MDEATLNQVREAAQQGLDSGKNPEEIKTLMKSSGYSDEEIGQIMLGVKVKAATPVPAPTAPFISTTSAMPSTSIKCLSCGTDNKQGDIFCANCGKTLKETAPAAKPITGHPSSSNTKPLFIIGGVVVIVIIAAFFLMNQSGTQSATQPGSGFPVTQTGGSQFTPPSTSTGTPIRSSQDLAMLVTNPTGTFVLESDIDMQGVSWTPIKEFIGVFDGKGHVIKNLAVNSDSDIGGLFEENSGTVMNIGLENVAIMGIGRGIGGLIGENTGVVYNSYVTGTVSGEGLVGGLVGDNGGQIENSYANVAVMGSSNSVGGLVGENTGSISGSYSMGTVTGLDFWNGGLVGTNEGTIVNSYSSANITALDDVGGFVGSNDGTIEDSYSTGNVEGESNVGGFLGSNSEGYIGNSFSTGAVSGPEDETGGFVGWNNDDSRGIENSYYYNFAGNPGRCTGFEIGESDCEPISSLEYFYDSNNEPMSSWGTIPWTFSGNSLPTPSGESGSAPSAVIPSGTPSTVPGNVPITTPPTGSGSMGTVSVDEFRTTGMIPFSCEVDYDVTIGDNTHRDNLIYTIAMKYANGKFYSKWGMSGLTITAPGDVVMVMIVNMNPDGSSSVPETFVICAGGLMCMDMTAMMSEYENTNPEVFATQESYETVFDPNNIDYTMKKILGYDAICFDMDFPDVDEYGGCFFVSLDCPMIASMNMRGSDGMMMDMMAVSVDARNIPSSEFDLDTSGTYDLTELMEGLEGLEGLGGY